MPFLVAEGNPSLAIAIAALFLAVSMGGAIFYFTSTLPNDPKTIDEGDETTIEPEKPEPPIECSIDEREVLGGDDSSVIGCEKIIAPNNATFEHQYITLTRGNHVIVNWSIEGDYTTPILHPCTDSSASLQPIIKPIMNSLKVMANDIGNSTCVIEFSNPAGTLNYTISVEVLDLPPSNLEYQHPIYILTKDEPFTIFPNYDDGTPTNWESNPALPQGLELREDGAIVGSPSTLITATNFVITASNSGGFDNTNITLIIHDESPNSVNYIDSELILTLGEQMNDISPSHSGGDIERWEIEPELPLGLSFSNSTGRISGTPLILQERTGHIVYANNSGGTDVTLITITVNDHPVNSIDYGVNLMDLIIDLTSVNVTPNTSGGTPVEWGIEPDLPHGLEFDIISGRIEGVGDTITPWVNHTIWANNSGGAFSSWLEIRVVNITPNNISWQGGTEHVLAANQSININAINGGPGIDTWEVYPALPDGLTLSTLNGDIDGSPIGRNGVGISRHAWTTHTIWANNSGGSFITNHTFAIHDLNQDHNELVKRPIGSVNYGGAWPSLILPIGEWSFGLGIDWDDRPISSAGHAGKGRIVGYGHETMVARTSNNEMANLSLNSLDWVCDGVGKTVGLESSFNGWKNTLLSEGYAVVESATPANLVNLDCFVTEFWNSYTDSENLQLTDWLTNGGGLIMGGHSWYWSYSNSDVAHNYPGNKIAKTTGLFVSASSGSSTFSVNQNEWGDLHRLHGSLPLIVDHVSGTQMMTQNDATTAAKTISLCVSTLPLDYTGVWNSLRMMSNNTGWIHIDSSTTYSMNADEVDDLILTIQEELMMKLPADELDAHPSHVSFPGSVNSTSPRPTKTVQIDGNFSGLPSQFGYANARSAGRMSTGMYAPAGEVVNITLPQSIIGQGVSILVGAHSDSLWGKTTLSRHPKIIRYWSIDNTTMQVGNSFGGPIYITIAAGTVIGDFNVTIEGAVEMPHYIHGVTDLQNWTTVQRLHPAPIAELESDYFILTVPSWGIRNLDHPNETMIFWDEALQMEHNLSGYTPWPRIERAVFDVQISAGWMHSGYPFMAHTASVSGVVNGSYMYQNGDWGMFHELGHNHQWMSSTLPGNTETTCNLYSMRLMEDLVGITGHGSMSPSNRQSRTETYFNNGAQISSWSVWTALETHIQIKEAFGWEPITAAYQEYYYNYSSQPSGDSEEFNQWAIQISLNTGHNLMPYLAAWGFPLVQSSWNAVGHLPVWNTDPLRGWVYEYDPITKFEITSNITSNTADLEWDVYDNGTNTSWNLCWGLTDGGVSTTNWNVCESLGNNLSVGSKGHSLSGLLSSTDYYWRLTATNSNGRWWSDSTRQFTTS